MKAYVNEKVLKDNDIYLHDVYRFTIDNLLEFAAKSDCIDILLSKINYIDLLRNMMYSIQSGRTAENYPFFSFAGFNFICLPKEVSDKYEALL